MMKKAIVIPNPTRDEGFFLTMQIISYLVSLGISVFVDRSYSLAESKGLTLYQTPPIDADIIIVVGGDGSVIDASILAIQLDIPILGVNLGKVGYLSEVEPDAVKNLSRLVTGEYTVEKKMLLASEIITADGERKSCCRFAVNDVVISQDGYFGIACFSAENSRREIVNYRGNGLIIATPVGSTAYSLSAGGPVIAHNLDSITVTPVCPHSFFNRSIVYEPDECLTVTNTGELALNISVDGRNFAVMNKGDRCKVYRSSHRLKMLTFSENNMFTALFRKIKVFEN